MWAQRRSLKPQLFTTSTQFRKHPRIFLKIYFWGKRPSTAIKPLFTDKVQSNLSFYKSYLVFWNAVWVSNFQIIITKYCSSFETIVGGFCNQHQLTIGSWFSSQRLFVRVTNLFCSFYKSLLFYNSLRFGQFLYHKQRRVSSVFDHNLYLTFSPSRFYINLRNYANINYFSLSVGLFLKFFNNQKSLKKTKTFKFLLVKLLRKLLIVSGIRQFVIFFKRPPILLAEVFRFLTSPLITPFYDPVQDKTCIEDDRKYTRFSFKYFFFLKTVSYTTMKGKQKGRLKRKISKKIIKRNRIADEA